MKSVASLLALAVFAALPVHAQSERAVAPKFAPAPPPPGLNDPGVKAQAPPASPATTRAATSEAGHGHLDLKPQAAPAMHYPHATETAPEKQPAPEVTVHQEGDSTIQEYRRSGQLYMVVVTPRSGVPHTFMVNPQGQLVDEHGQKPVAPVMYKVLEWGKSKPAGDDGDDSGH